MSVVNLAYVNRSSTITTGGTAQTAVAANSGRLALVIHNVDAAEALYVNLVGTAVVDGAGGIKLAAGATLIFDGSGIVPTNAVSVIAATTGHKFTIYEG